MNSRITVVMYRAENDEPCHWAIWIKDANAKSIILQVGRNKDGYCVEEPILRDPLLLKRIKHAVYCGAITSGEQDLALSIIQNHPVDNESATWNCQAWIMEVLEGMEQTGLLHIAPGSKATLESMRQEV